MEQGRIAYEEASRAKERIATETDLEAAVVNGQVVIEAIPERRALKLELFKRLDQSAAEGAILATNTSSLSITRLGRVTRHPDRVVGMHFFNPPVRRQLVEVIRGEKTSDETMDLICRLAESFRKTPIRVEKDVRAFVVNRISIAYMVEADWIISRGEATAEQVDSRMKYYEGFPMGPFKLQDFSGLDVGYDFLTEAQEAIPPILEEKIRKGELGRKSGKGFYDYGKTGVQYSRQAGEHFDPTPFYALMANEAAWLIENGVSTPEQIDMAVRLGLGFPEGILPRADRIGLDRLLEVLREGHRRFSSKRYEPVALLEAMVAEGKTGVAAGQGFYNYR